MENMDFRDIGWKYVSLDQHIGRLTRVTKQNKPSLLELFLTDKTLETLAIDYNPPLGKSDHTLIQATCG